MEQIKKGDIVSLIYDAKLPNGKIFDSADSSSPLIFRVGDNRLLKKFEDAVIGMLKGEKKIIFLKSKDAYGNYDDSLVFSVNKSIIPEDISINIGSPLQIMLGDGTYGIAIIKDIKGETVIIDANHPLAGIDITFDITIVGINEISEEEFYKNYSSTCDSENCSCGGDDCNC